MSLTMFLVLLVVLIIGIYILKSVIKIALLVAVLGLFLWFLDSNNIIDIRHTGDNVTVSDGKNATKLPIENKNKE